MSDGVDVNVGFQAHLQTEAQTIAVNDVTAPSKQSSRNLSSAYSSLRDYAGIRTSDGR